MATHLSDIGFVRRNLACGARDDSGEYLHRNNDYSKEGAVCPAKLFGLPQPQLSNPISCLGRPYMRQESYPYLQKEGRDANVGINRRRSISTPSTYSATKLNCSVTFEMQFYCKEPGVFIPYMCVQPLDRWNMACLIMIM